MTLFNKYFIWESHDMYMTEQVITKNVLAIQEIGRLEKSDPT